MNLFVAAMIALRTPHYIAGDRWRALLDPAPDMGGKVPPHHTRPATILLMLHRVAPAYWKATCLYRSVAVAVGLRQVGVGAVLKLGVKREGEELGAHAWIEDGQGNVVYGEREDFTPLR